MARTRARRFLTGALALGMLLSGCGTTETDKVSSVSTVQAGTETSTTLRMTAATPVQLQLAADPVPTYVPPPAEYVVQESDNKGLSGIAEQTRNTHPEYAGMTWQDLCGRNTDQIKDCNVIRPGMVLRLTGPVDALPVPPAPPAPAPPAPEPVTAPTPSTDVAEVADAQPAPAPTPEPAPAPAPAAVVAHITNSAGAVKPHVQAAANAVVSNVPCIAGNTIGGTRASAADPNGHPSGLALDYMVYSDSACGDAIVEYHIAHWDELGVEYIIWQQRILTSPGGSWQPMGNRGSATANHMDHPHVNYR